MNRQHVQKVAFIFITSILAISSLSTICFAQNYERQYVLMDGENTYRLTLSVTHSLYEHYQDASHSLTPQLNFDNFVTPYSMALVAEDIRSIYPDDEDFINGVLMVVHQITYEPVEGIEYPVETIVEDRGDCDLLSLIASSIIISQGIDVILLYYEDESHMNIGVSLSNPPSDARTPVTYLDHMGNRYYIAECTGNDWQNGWKVGELPSELEGASSTPIVIDDYEDVAPGQVSSTFGSLLHSSISLTVSPVFGLVGDVVEISGQVSASNTSGTVNLFASRNNSWFSIGTAQLDPTGRYMYSFTIEEWGHYYIKASWPGDAEHAGADSRAVSLFVAPKKLFFVVGALILLAVIAGLLYIIYRATHPREVQPYTEY